MESFWEQPEMNIGEVEVNTTNKVYFQAKENIPPIINIIPGCGCTDFRYDKKTKRLHVEYQAGRIPRHLGTNSVDITKYIRITYNDQRQESLSFTGKKVKKK